MKNAIPAHKQNILVVTSGLKWLANADTVVEHLKQMLQNSEKGTSVSKYYRKCKLKNS